MMKLISLQYLADEEALLLCCNVYIGIIYDVGSPTSKSSIGTSKIDAVSIYIAELINLVYFYMQCNMISDLMLIRKYLQTSMVIYQGSSKTIDSEKKMSEHYTINSVKLC